MTICVGAVLNAFEQLRMPARAHLGVTKLAHQSALNPATQLRRHRLHSVADAQHRDAKREDDLRRARGIVLNHRCMAAGENDAFRIKGADIRVRHIKGVQFAVHAGFAHATCDELRNLRTEVEDENFVGQGFHIFRSMQWV